MKNGGISTRLTIVFAAILVCASGCQARKSSVEVYSLRSPNQPEVFTEAFSDGHFRLSSERTYEIVFKLDPQLLEVPHLETESHADGEENATAPPPDLVWTSQILRIQILWQPHPGKSFAESTQTNASITYCLVNGENAISYEGAGFVFFKLSRDGRTMKGRIESASLRPTRYRGSPFDLFGPCRLKGEFTASQGSREVAAVRQRLRRLLGPPVISNDETYDSMRPAGAASTTTAIKAH